MFAHIEMRKIQMTTTTLESESGTRRLTTAKAISRLSPKRCAPTKKYLSWVRTSVHMEEFSVLLSGLFDEFGASPHYRYPNFETGFIGAGIGAAVEGMRPIVELMFVDFFGVCMDQIYNHMAKIHYESGGNVKVPMVLMMAAGGGYSDAAAFPVSLGNLCTYACSLKVVVPSNPYDAKGLMISAIRDDNPVLFMFHSVMGLPWMAKNPRSIGPVPEDAYTVPIGEAIVAHTGSDVTVVSISLSVQHCLDVAEALEGKISVEVLDLRTIAPLDRDAILASVSKIGRLVIVDEDYQSFGLSGEIVATITDKDPRLLKT